MRYWLPGPDLPEPEQEEVADLTLEQDPQQHPENPEPVVEAVDELQLQTEVHRLEGEVHRLMRQLEITEAQLAQTEELLAASRQFGGEQYQRAEFANHQHQRLGEILQRRLEQEVNRPPPDDEVQALVTQRINELIRHPVHFTPAGEVWHSSRLCCQQRTGSRITTRRPCAWCASDMRLRELDG